MATTALFEVIKALLSKLPDRLPEGVTLYDGYPVDDTYADEYLLIGVEDPSMTTAAAAGSSRQTRRIATGRRERDDDGTVTCAAGAWNGDGDPQAARDQVEAITVAVEGLMRDEYDLGLTDVVLWTDFGPSFELYQNQTSKGADCLAVFRIAYRANL